MKKILFILLAAMSFFPSCKKNSDNTPPPPGPGNFIRVKTSVSAYESLKFSYDNAGRLIERISNGTTKVTYEYPSGKVIQKVFTPGGVLSDTWTFTLDANGLSTQRTYDQDAAYLETTLYNSDKQIVKTITQGSGYTEGADYFYSNGNLDSCRFSSNGAWTFTSRYTYYTDKPNVMDPENYGEAHFGKGSKNLYKTFQYVYPDGTITEITNVSYEYDAKGRVIKRISQKGANTGFINYTYE
jgi:YD repeat-containing protein